MRQRLGTILVKDGLIAEKDLEEALQRQVIFGGRLGTNLLEMGVLAEETLLKVLSQQQGVPYAEPHFFDNIPKGVIESVPADLVDHHGVVPINKEKNRIILAMIEPTRLDVIDDVQFRTNCVVKPVIATELRITQALERYYHIRRDLRFIAVPSAPGKTPDAPDIINFEKGMPMAWAKRSALDLPPAPPPGPAAAPVVAAATPAAPPAPAPEGPPEIEEEPLSLETVNLRLLEAHNRNDVGTVIIEATAKAVDSAVLFLIKGDEASGWVARGDIAIPDIPQWKFKMEKNSILALIQESKTLVRGPGKALFHTNPWLAPVSPTLPHEVITIPLVIKGHVVAVLMGFVRERQLHKDEVEFLVRLMRKATVTFEILILKSKLVMV